MQELVQDELLTVAAARERFGVAIDPVTLEVDEGETVALRGRRGGEAEPPLWLPQGAGEAEYWKERYRDGDELVWETMPAALRLGLSAEAR